MAGFKNIREYVDACEGGKNWITGFRKGVTSSSPPAQQIDISSGSGTYPPNYFASAPLTASLMQENKGIFVPNTGTRKYIKDFTVMNTPLSATTTANDGLHATLADYVMYYPFIDLTVADLQELDNSVTLPRYTDGRGLRMMMIMQSSSGNYSAVDLTINYVNQDGNDATVTGGLQYSAFSPYAIVAPTVPGQNAYGRYFIPFARGDSGVRRINSVKLSADWGGLAVFVIVKPLMSASVWNTQGARRTTAGNLDSFGSPSQWQNLIHSVSGSWIEDGAYLTPICQMPNNSGGGALVGTVETVWGS